MHTVRSAGFLHGTGPLKKDHQTVAREALQRSFMGVLSSRVAAAMPEGIVLAPSERWC